MSHQKIDLNAVLAAWPAPARPESEWEARADAIVEAITASPKVTAAELSALCDVAALPAEAGEPGGEPKAPPDPMQARSGEKKMSQESDPSSGSPKKDSIRPSEGEPKKKLSLKEIAERASQSGRPGPVSSRSSQSDIPPAVKTPLPGRAAMSSRPSSPTPSRPPEAGRDDSGVVDLKIVQASVTAEQKAAADKAQPGMAGLFDDDKDGQAKAAVAPKPELKVVAAAPAAKKGSGGLVAGIAVAVLGLAAAVAIVKLNQPPPAPAAAVPAKAEATPDPKAAVADQPKAAPTAADPAAPADTAAPQKVAAGPAPAGGPAAVAPAAGAAKEGAPPAEAPQPMAANPTPAPAAATKPGDLKSAMQDAVGPTGTKSGGSEDAEPAAAKKGSQNVPEQPSQGAVSAALGSSIGAAKSCVAGGDDVSRASVTFGSSGAVSGVTVTGWAAGKKEAGCIKSAFKSANVGPFSKPSFTVSVTLRP